MNSFGFAAVPYLPWKMMTDTLTPTEMLILALRTDEKVLNRLANQNSTMDNPSIDVIIEAERKTVEVRFEDSEENIKISFAEVLDPEATFTVITTQGASQLYRTLQNVQRLFRGSVSQMSVDLGVLNEETLSRIVEIPCEKFHLVGAPKNITSRGLADALNKVVATEEYCIQSNIKPKVFPTAFPTQKFSMKFAHGITESDLLRIAGKTAEVELLNSHLTSGAVHKFIKSWFKSTETTTVSLKVSRKDKKTFDLKQLLGDIQHSEYQVGTRQKNFVTRRTGVPKAVREMSKAFDFVRADGLRASVCVTDSELFFGVWHDPHEIQERLNEFTRKRNQVQRLVAESRSQRDRMMDHSHHDVIDIMGITLEFETDEAKKTEMRRTMEIFRSLQQHEDQEIEELNRVLRIKTPELNQLRDTVNTLTSFL